MKVAFALRVVAFDIFTCESKLVFVAIVTCSDLPVRSRYALDDDIS